MEDGIREPAKALFIAIPRTGSLSMIDALRPHGMAAINLHQHGVVADRFDLGTRLVTFHHASIPALIQAGVLSDDWLQSRWVFAVVRNPWDRLVSLYHYLFGPLLERYIHEYGALTFAEFVHQVTEKPNDPIGLYNWRGLSMTSPQSDWLRGICVTPMIYLFENLPGAINHISLRLQQDLRLPHLNATERRPYPEYYSQTLRDIVGEYYAEDIEQFRYTFEGT